MSTQFQTFDTFNQETIEVYLVSPSQFICQNQEQLLPDWNTPIEQIILILQRSAISLKERDKQVSNAKNLLRANFLRLGCHLIFALQDEGYTSDLFDPRSGFPLLSPKGELALDDNAVVRASLGYQTIAYRDCSLLQHPVWGDLVYPGTIVTTAPQPLIRALISSNFLGNAIEKYKLINI